MDETLEVMQAVAPSWLEQWLPATIAFALLVIVWFVIRKVFSAQKDQGADIRYREQGTRLIFRLCGVVLLIATLPMSGELRGQLFSLFGLLASAAIALSSTSVMGNLMAGFMLRTVDSFKAGDYVEFRGELGRVSQRGLLHVEIQNETSELVTVPNLLLVQEPYNVVRSSGTVISADVSLGYDVDRRDVEEALLAAIAAAELDNGFVQIRELGDFSITYRASGWLEEAGMLVSARSKLRGRMLDALHDAEIEIVSPSFMNQRRVEGDTKVIPVRGRFRREKHSDGHAEEVLFSKAELASAVEKIERKMKQLKDKLNTDSDSDEDIDRDAVKAELAQLTEELEQARIANKEEDKRDENEKKQEELDQTARESGTKDEKAKDTVR